jgi:hypothetical protein
MDYDFETNNFLDLQALQIHLQGLPFTGISQTQSSVTIHCTRELTLEELTLIEEKLLSATQQILVPSIVTPRQIRVALIMSGFPLQTIEDAIDTLPEPNKSIVRVTWEYSVEFQRSNPFISSMAPLLNLTETQIDELFILASTL